MCRWRPYSESTRIFSRRRATGTMQCRASATMCAGWHPMGQLYAPGLAQPRLPQCASQGWRALHRPLLQLLDWRGLGLRVRLSASLCILGASEYALVHPFQSRREARLSFGLKRNTKAVLVKQNIQELAAVAAAMTVHACSGMTACRLTESERWDATQA